MPVRALELGDELRQVLGEDEPAARDGDAGAADDAGLAERLHVGRQRHPFGQASASAVAENDPQILAPGTTSFQPYFTGGAPVALVWIGAARQFP